MIDMNNIPEAQSLTPAQRAGIAVKASSPEEARQLVAILLANIAAAGQKPRDGR